MQSTFVYLGELFGVFFAGMLLAVAVGRERFHRVTAILLMFSLYLLLFFMGVNTARIEGIYSMLGSMGLSAFLLTISAVAGSFVLGLGYDVIKKRRSGFSGESQSPKSHLMSISLSSLKSPLSMVLCVAVGMVLQTFLPSAVNWYFESSVDALLFSMMGLVGMQMMQNEVNWKSILRSFDILMLPVLTISGSYLGIMIYALFSDFSVRQCLAMVSGFGWYSMSGVLITNAGLPVMGTISFLANLMREMLGFFLVPLLGLWFPRRALLAICVSGTSSMDFLLPLIKQNYCIEAVPKAIIHGCIIAFFVPILIPIWL